MTLHLWTMFVAAVFFLSATPGPNMLHILSRSVELGFRGSFPAMLGCFTGLISLLVASAAGLTALLLAVPGAFTVLRYAGTAYLVYLGIKAWRAPAEPAPEMAVEAPATLSPFAVWRGGFLISVSNPKALLFAVAFLPQFINPMAPKVAQFAILIATFGVIEIFWYLTYALGGRGLARHLERPSLKRAFNRMTGVVFLGFGALLLKAQKA